MGRAMSRRRPTAAPSLFAEPAPVAPPPVAERPTPRAPVVFAPTPPAERIEAVPGFLEAVLDANGCMHIGWRERDEPLAHEQRSHGRATTPSPALVERLRGVCPATGLRGAVPGRLSEKGDVR